MELQPSLADIKEVIDNEQNKVVLWTKIALDVVFKCACKYKTIPDFHMLSPFTIYLEKDTPYRKLFNYQ